jgi:hypothetical protein
MFLMIIENKLQIILKTIDQYKNKTSQKILYPLACLLNNNKYYFFTLQFKKKLFNLQVLK